MIADSGTPGLAKVALCGGLQGGCGASLEASVGKSIPAEVQT
jgi:hypothetical protein